MCDLDQAPVRSASYAAAPTAAPDLSASASVASSRCVLLSSFSTVTSVEGNLLPSRILDEGYLLRNGRTCPLYPSEGSCGTPSDFRKDGLSRISPRQRYQPTPPPRTSTYGLPLSSHRAFLLVHTSPHIPLPPPHHPALYDALSILQWSLCSSGYHRSAGLRSC